MNLSNFYLSSKDHNLFQIYVIMYISGGTHGYDNSLMKMHPFFIAKGPVFKKDYVSEPFSNVNIYPLICHILKVS